MRSLTSSPSSGTGKPGKGPVTDLHDENASVSWYIGQRLVVAGDQGDVVVGFAVDRAPCSRAPSKYQYGSSTTDASRKKSVASKSFTRFQSGTASSGYPGS